MHSLCHDCIKFSLPLAECRRALVNNSYGLCRIIQRSSILSYCRQHFTGNAKPDELAKLGSDAAYIGPEPAVDMAPGEAKKIITEWCYQEHSDLWLRTTRLAHSNEFIRRPSKNRTNNLLQLSRPHLRAKAHMHRIGLAESRWCMEDDESVAHLLCRCPTLANHI